VKAAHRTKVGGQLTAAMRRDLAEVVAGTCDEYVFQRVVIACALDHGWLVHHTPRAKVRPGQHVTPTQGHLGFPDLVLCRGDELLVVELKSKRGTTTTMQDVWLGRLADAGATVHVWRPADWPTIRSTLTASLTSAG
jgi:hypothetical protein